MYPDFECNLESAVCSEGSYSKKYQNHIPCSFFTNLFVLMINLINRFLFLEVKTLPMNLVKQSLKSIDTVKK